MRILCAISFTAGGGFLAATEPAYQAFAPLNHALDRVRSELFEHPERPEVRLRVEVADGIRPHVRRAWDFAHSACLWGAGLLTGAGLIGMIIGNRLGVTIARLEADRTPKGSGPPFDPEFG